MSRIVFLGAPAFGHINPTLPVVQELVQRGETVIYYDTENFRPLIERTGAEFRAYPQMEFNADAISEALRDGNMSSIPILIYRATDTLLPFVLDELAREKPDAVVFDSTAMWGKMACNQLKLKDVGSISHLSFNVGKGLVKFSEIIQLMGNMVSKLPDLITSRRRLVRRYGNAFPDTKPVFPMRGGLNIIYTSRELHPETPMIDSTFRFVGPSINEQTRDEDFPFDLLTQGKTIYISLGTVHHGQIEFYKRCFEAFKDFPAQFVLSVGKGTDISSLGEIPSNFIVRPSVLQLEVLQHTDVFITHGGLNSIHEGLYYGVPLIFIPQQLEQMLNARIITQKGAAVIVNKKASAEELRKTLETFIADTRYRTAAAALQQTLRATGGYREAADEIQAYIAGNKTADG